MLKAPWNPYVTILALSLGLGSCKVGEYAATVVGGALVTTLATTPGSEIEQVYYFGVFDPLEQVQPPQVYRVTVRGQASMISSVKFASGWLPAQVVDSLGSRVSFADDGNVQVEKGDAGNLAKLKPGRRLVLFGPEGFREAPKDHRLVIVMGADADEFFGAIEEALGTVARAKDNRGNATLHKKLFEALSTLRGERSRIDEFAVDLEVSLKEGGN